MKWTEDRLNEIASDARANVICVMEKYGNNKWWESDDPARIAQYQLFEDILMVDFSTYHEGIEKLLDRHVWTHEFGINMKGLREEARIAIHRRDVGSDYTGISDVQRDRKIEQSINSLREFAAKNNKDVILVIVGGK